MGALAERSAWAPFFVSFWARAKRNRNFGDFKGFDSVPGSAPPKKGKLSPDGAKLPSVGFQPYGTGQKQSAL